ncbi:MAG: hypothetical protein CL912_13415 [Deltaproteobacteria bacterium]|nr:hypothetical protein [Deltaproteobacteria bacterium]
MRIRHPTLLGIAESPNSPLVHGSYPEARNLISDKQNSAPRHSQDISIGSEISFWAFSVFISMGLTSLTSQGQKHDLDKRDMRDAIWSDGCLGLNGGRIYPIW